jgi:hypothetical protein
MNEGFNKSAKFRKIIIERQFGETELTQLRKHHRYTAIALHRTRHENLEFLKLLPELQSVELYATHIADYGAMVRIDTLEKLFLSGIRPHENLSFVSELIQLKELDLLYLNQLHTLPDLSACKRLTKVMLWNCKRLTDIASLSRIPNLEEVQLVDTPQKPEDLEFLMQCHNLRYISAQFGTIKANRQFEELLVRYGKTRHRP